MTTALHDARQRLAVEARILQKYFPRMRLQDAEGGVNPGAIGTMRTNDGNEYTLWVPLGRFPYEPPAVYVLAPALVDHRGRRLASYGTSAAMHLLSPDDHGHPRICHHSGDSWHSRLTLYHVLVKARLWLEAYERHRQTGSPLDTWLTHMGA